MDQFFGLLSRNKLVLSFKIQSKTIKPTISLALNFYPSNTTNERSMSFFFVYSEESKKKKKKKNLKVIEKAS